MPGAREAQGGGISQALPARPAEHIPALLVDDTLLRPSSEPQAQCTSRAQAPPVTRCQAARSTCLLQSRWPRGGRTLMCVRPSMGRPFMSLSLTVPISRPHIAGYDFSPFSLLSSLLSPTPSAVFDQFFWLMVFLEKIPTRLGS